MQAITRASLSVFATLLVLVRIPLGTNTVVVNFEQLATNCRDTACDVILLDTTFWGGM